MVITVLSKLNPTFPITHNVRALKFCETKYKNQRSTTLFTVSSTNRILNVFLNWLIALYEALVSRLKAGKLLEQDRYFCWRSCSGQLFGFLNGFTGSQLVLIVSSCLRQLCVIWKLHRTKKELHKIATSNSGKSCYMSICLCLITQNVIT